MSSATAWRRSLALWAIPAAALVISTWLLISAEVAKGPLIQITFGHGQGLKRGDPLMFKGVRAGEVHRISLEPGLTNVTVDVRLHRDAAELATDDSRFWIVRPEVSLSRVSGLETLVGPRYIEAARDATPHAKACTVFSGLVEPPLADRPGTAAAYVPRTGDLVIVLEADRAGGTAVGSPILFRGVKVGQLLSARLSSTASEVEIEGVIFAPFAHLVREGSRWWNISGFGLDFGLVGGLSLRTNSLESLISGGIAFATPDRPSPRAAAGHRFRLEAEAEKDWLSWSPDLTNRDGAPSGEASGSMRERGR